MDERLDDHGVCVPLKQFLATTTCPPEWRRCDLYLLRDDVVVFYVGQSYNAFERVWEHLRGGPKGRSIVGRFVLCNWPRSMRFTVELLSSQSPRFEAVGYDPGAAERYLIEQLAPCFNETLNTSPTPLPGVYLPPTAKIKHLKSLKRLLREAGYATRFERNSKSMAL